MTQQSLITRLKAVEEALEELDTLARNFSVSGVYFSEFEENVSALNKANRALSDLRELIKEAEEQKSAAFKWGDGVIEKTQLKHCEELYTALGEKP